MIPKVGIAAIGVLGAGTTVYLGYEYVFKSKEEGKKVTIGEKLSDFLLDTGPSDKWASRKTRLSKSDDNSLVEELKSLKSGVTEDKVRNWCSRAATKSYSEVSSLYLTNVRSYCTFYIEDKLPEGYLKQSEDWNKANNRLKAVDPETNLSDQMKGVKAELKKQDSLNENALKEWCVGVYEKPYLGEDNQDFKDAKSYCSKVTIAG